MSVLRTEDVNMVKQGTKYYVLSGHDSSTIIVFEFKKNHQKDSGKPDIFPTNDNPFYVAIFSGGFHLRSGRNLGEERIGGNQFLLFITPNESNGLAQLYAYNPKHTFHKTSDEDMYLNKEYEMHLGTKLDCLLCDLTITSSF